MLLSKESKKKKQKRSSCLIPCDIHSKMFTFVLLVLANAGDGDLVFHIPRQDYTLVFPSSRGGCLSSIVDTISGEEHIASPLTFRLSEQTPTVNTAPAFPCQNTTLNVLHQSSSSLSFTSSAATGVVMQVDVVLSDFIVLITHTGLANTTGTHGAVLGEFSLNTPVNPIVSYMYTMDGVPTNTLGTANRSETVTLVSNWIAGGQVHGSESSPKMETKTQHMFPVQSPLCDGHCCVLGDVNTTSSSTSLAMECNTGAFVIKFARLI